MKKIVKRFWWVLVLLFIALAFTGKEIVRRMRIANLDKEHSKILQEYEDEIDSINVEHDPGVRDAHNEWVRSDEALRRTKAELEGAGADNVGVLVNAWTRAFGKGSDI